MAIVKIVPMPGPGGNGSSGDTGNFVFDENSVSTNEDMTIQVNGVPGSITLSAYSGVELQFSDTEGSGLKFPDGSIQTTAYQANPFIPLPEFLSYEEGNAHLPNINQHFGWDSSGLWFGNAIESGGPDAGPSYPVFTNFTMTENDGVTVEFNVNWQDECSDIGICVYRDGDNPNWVWGPDATRISAQLNCLVPTIKGLTTEVEELTNFIPSPGMYHIVFTYLPFGGSPVMLQVFSGTNTSNLISSLTLNEVLEPGNYRVGFASDNNGGKTYISDMSIMVNENVPYTDTLQNGSSGDNADIADFAFDYNSGDQESTMTIHNHDMSIRTTRDDGQDADIGIYSADDIWIESTDTLRLSSTGDRVEIETSGEGPNTWTFTESGRITLPSGTAAIASGSDGTIITDSRTATFYADYQDGSTGINNNETVILPVNADTQWFSNNTYSTTTITFADSTSVQTVAIYDGTSQGTAGMIFQWSGLLTKTFEQTFPLVVTGNVTAPKEYVSLVAGDASWNFDMDGEVTFPIQPSNQRTGSGEVFKFGNSTQQSIITGSTPTENSPTAQRLVVAGQDGYAGTSGEGGDLYLWAGRGGSTGGSGGDIKLDAGNGGGTVGSGGTVKMRGGYSNTSTGGFVEITAGGSDSSGGGDVDISSGYSNTGPGGNVNIHGANTNSGNAGSVNIVGGNSSTANGGEVYISGGVGYDSATGNSVSGNVIIQAPAYSGKVFITGSNPGSSEFLGVVADPQYQIATQGDIPSIGDITFSANTIFGAGTASGDGAGNGTINLYPDRDLETDQYITIDPTQPNHIHIRAGGGQDNSGADLILGGEKTNVTVSDASGQVRINTKIPPQLVTYTNTAPAEVSGPLYVDASTSDPQIGDYIDYNGSRYTVVNFAEETPGTITVYVVNAEATPQMLFPAEGQVSYTFSRDYSFGPYWTFENNGYLSGWYGGSLGVYGLYSNETGVMPINSADKLLLLGTNGEFLNDADVPSNQIATIGDIATAAPTDTPFTVNGGTVGGTQPTFNGAPLFDGSYVKTGSLVTFRVNVDFTNILTFGTGQYYIQLPFTSKYGITMRDGCLHDSNTGNEWPITGHVVANSDILELHYSAGSGQDEAFDHNSPIVLSTLDSFHISGTYITAE